MLQATVDRFEENFAIVSFPNGDTLTIHIDDLPNDTTEGSILYFNPSLELEELPKEQLKDATDQDDLAKTILNQILKTG